VLFGPPPGRINGVPARSVRTRRPRLLPAALIASAFVVATGGGVLAATAGAPRPAADACASGSEYVTVRPVMDNTDPWKPSVPSGPALAGCVDSDKLTKAAEPTPTNPRG
jgi:hypothetical protein